MHDRSVAKGHGIPLSPEIAAMCESLLDRLDALADSSTPATSLVARRICMSGHAALEAAFRRRSERQCACRKVRLVTGEHPAAIAIAALAVRRRPAASTKALSRINPTPGPWCASATSSSVGQRAPRDGGAEVRSG